MVDFLCCNRWFAVTQFIISRFDCTTTKVLEAFWHLPQILLGHLEVMDIHLLPNKKGQKCLDRLVHVMIHFNIAIIHYSWPGDILAGHYFDQLRKHEKAVFTSGICKWLHELGKSSGLHSTRKSRAQRPRLVCGNEHSIEPRHNEATTRTKMSLSYPETQLKRKCFERKKKQDEERTDTTSAQLATGQFSTGATGRLWIYRIWHLFFLLRLAFPNFSNNAVPAILPIQHSEVPH